MSLGLQLVQTLGPPCEPTPRQAEAMEIIVKWREGYGRPIPFTILAEELGVKSTNAVTDLVRGLRKKGFLERTGPLVPTETAMVRILGEQCPHCVNGRRR